MKFKNKKIITVSVSIAIALLVLYLLFASIILVKSEPFNTQFIDLNGQIHTLKDFEGKFVFLNFWASWCKPCIDEIPSIERLKNKFDRSQIEFIIASDENLELIKAFQAKSSSSLDFYKYKATTQSTLIPQLLPMTYLIKGNGEIYERFLGSVNWDSSESVKKLEKWLTSK